jgi:hypothetical protein
MAIVIEEEKKKSRNLLAASGWFVIIVIILIAGYYLFLAQPGSVIVTPPANFAGLQPIAQITVLPQDVISMGSFQLLHTSAAPLIATSSVIMGRPSPFVAP